MKINTFKLYKWNVWTSWIMGIVLMVGSVAFYIFVSERDRLAQICLCVSALVAFLISLFPVLIFHRHLTCVYLERDRCIAYSFGGHQLCQVDYNKQVFYSLFDVYGVCGPPIRFAALSNSTFKCKQNTKSIFEEKFYGYYDQSKIVVFPYDTNLDPLLHLDAWHKIISE